MDVLAQQWLSNGHGQPIGTTAPPELSRLMGIIGPFHRCPFRQFLQVNPFLLEPKHIVMISRRHFVVSLRATAPNLGCSAILKRAKFSIRLFCKYSKTIQADPGSSALIWSIKNIENMFFKSWTMIQSTLWNKNRALNWTMKGRDRPRCKPLLYSFKNNDYI